MTHVSIEEEIVAKGLVAPRVTVADIEAAICAEVYFTADEAVRRVKEITGGYRIVRHTDDEVEGPLSLLTFCVLVLTNGFTVTGESACASPENFDAELGRKIARQNAVGKCWSLLGYALKERLARGTTPA
jgi:hypothetical protein